MTTITIVITPRERYYGVIECIDAVCENTDEPFDLIITDIGYPKALIKQVEQRIKSIPNAKIIDYGGMVTPMKVFEHLVPIIKTDMLVWVETDTTVLPGWMPPLIESINDGAAFVSPLTLEKEGVDQGAKIRNHLYTCKILVVEYEGVDYLIEAKEYRRELPENIPLEIRPTETFEWHTVAFKTEDLQEIDFPDMVMRQQIDIPMQLRAQGKTMVANPFSKVIFDNLCTRLTIKDMQYFFFVWSHKLNEKSHREFEKRWGYNFYSEQSIYNWVFRRKAFLICRFFFIPIPLANKITGLAKRIFCKDWDPLKDPIGDSRQLSQEIGNPEPNR
ncbi:MULTISPECIES: glycosyltransferase family 2 protein [unclassified Colwellia]|jgi:hypothetical protein|uniref:glycosyltransferase family 2 protein n=1 Tax=unclassified Colwellia TaxID=196834 RepID=UPI0015F38EF9|nr:MULTISPECIES: glycosyltransferase [unclassified Colwellia]MBA6225832.1 glycosyltransferase [Colwellia sp. MB3u-45]MBA6267068.1 glycosyltransferase [Colwellia sp. MB3u-43]MBA6290423.1 glycosyltransferase [Colwellia sp. MB3u-4]MBA6295156.1 glycosyltransferase [Colwellia sp. MB02u-9]MBA6321992.1 glycosyltransferase [Colwellia sp. MB02u-19]